jgi:hypothetical protein
LEGETDVIDWDNGKAVLYLVDALEVAGEAVVQLYVALQDTCQVERVVDRSARRAG